MWFFITHCSFLGYKVSVIDYNWIEPNMSLITLDTVPIPIFLQKLVVGGYFASFFLFDNLLKNGLNQSFFEWIWSLNGK